MTPEQKEVLINVLTKFSQFVLRGEISINIKPQKTRVKIKGKAFSLIIEYVNLPKTDADLSGHAIIFSSICLAMGKTGLLSNNKVNDLAKKEVRRLAETTNPSRVFFIQEKS